MPKGRKAYKYLFHNALYMEIFIVSEHAKELIISIDRRASYWPFYIQEVYLGIEAITRKINIISVNSRCIAIFIKIK